MNSHEASIIRRNLDELAEAFPKASVYYARGAYHLEGTEDALHGAPIRWPDGKGDWQATATKHKYLLKELT